MQGGETKVQAGFQAGPAAGERKARKGRKSETPREVQGKTHYFDFQPAAGERKNREEEKTTQTYTARSAGQKTNVFSLPQGSDRPGQGKKQYTARSVGFTFYYFHPAAGKRKARKVGKQNAYTSI